MLGWGTGSRDAAGWLGSTRTVPTAPHPGHLGRLEICLALMPCAGPGSHGAEHPEPLHLWLGYPCCALFPRGEVGG